MNKHFKTKPALLSQLIEVFLCCKQRQLAICQKVLLVVGNNDITVTGNSTLVLQHVLKVLTGCIDSSTKLCSIHWKYGNKSFQSVKLTVDLFFCVVMFSHVSKIGKCQDRSKNGDSSSPGYAKQSCTSEAPGRLS